VNGHPGSFDARGTQILTFQIAGGQWVVIQAPVWLGWDRAELAKFASDVRVLVTAAGPRLSPACRASAYPVGYGVGRPR
jgi:hypothetical protein